MEPLKIGNITLPHRAVFGPMAGFTDAPCRRLMARRGLYRQRDGVQPGAGVRRP